MVIITLLYTLTAFMIGSIALSYWIAYTIKKRTSILSLALFLTSIFIVSISHSISAFMDVINGSYEISMIKAIAAFTVLLSSLFLFYTTWKDTSNS